MARAAKSCPRGCSPSAQRKLVARFARELRKCSAKPAKRAKRAKPGRARVERVVERVTLRELAATVERHGSMHAAQGQWNEAVREGFAVIYQRGAVPTLGAPSRQIGPPPARRAVVEVVRQLPAPSGAAKPRKARKARSRVSVEAIEQTVEALESDPFAIPQAIGPEGYRPPQCASDHDPWASSDYGTALEDARERASIEAGDDEEAYRRGVHDLMRAHPSFPSWSTTERECVADFRLKHPRKRRRTETATTETARAIEDAARDAGYDIRGSAEHLDRLSLGGQASYWRRLHRKTGSVDALRRAREIETRLRARKRKGAGVATFAVG